MAAETGQSGTKPAAHEIVLPELTSSDHALVRPPPNWRTRALNPAQLQGPMDRISCTKGFDHLGVHEHVDVHHTDGDTWILVIAM